MLLLALGGSWGRKDLQSARQLRGRVVGPGRLFGVPPGRHGERAAAGRAAHPAQPHGHPGVLPGPRRPAGAAGRRAPSAGPGGRRRGAGRLRRLGRAHPVDPGGRVRPQLLADAAAAPGWAGHRGTPGGTAAGADQAPAIRKAPPPERAADLRVGRRRAFIRDDPEASPLGRMILPLLGAQRPGGRGPGGDRGRDRGQQVPGQQDHGAAVPSAGKHRDHGARARRRAIRRSRATPSGPSATPSGTPTTSGDQQRQAWSARRRVPGAGPRVMPSVLSRASSRRRRRTEVSTVSASEAIAAAASPRARASGWPPIWVALTMDAARAWCSVSW